MRVHFLKHVPYEGPGSIADWAEQRGHAFSGTELHAGQALPAQEEIDALVVMGGPMGVADEAQHPWLAPEKRYLRRWIERGRPVLGVCLGAQLIAAVMGARVTRNPHIEIGWYPIRRLPQISMTAYDGILPPTLEVFHWHGDTFGIPDGAIPIAASEACFNQGFVYRDRVLALQFHLEMDEPTLREMLDQTEQSLAPAPYVQSAEEMLARPERFRAMRSRLFNLLDAWLEN